MATSKSVLFLALVCGVTASHAASNLDPCDFRATPLTDADLAGLRSADLSWFQDLVPADAAVLNARAKAACQQTGCMQKTSWGADQHASLLIQAGFSCRKGAPSGASLPVDAAAAAAGLKAVCAARTQNAGLDPKAALQKEAPAEAWQRHVKTDIGGIKSAKGNLGTTQGPGGLKNDAVSAQGPGGKKDPSAYINAEPKKLSPDKSKVPAMMPPPAKVEEPSLGGFFKDYIEGMSTHLYPDDVVGDRQKEKSLGKGALQEHRVIMNRLIDYHTQHHDSKASKTTLDVVVGISATAAYNFVAGPIGGVYQVVTGEDPGGLGLGGHLIVGVKDVVKGDLKAAWDHAVVGVSDIAGDFAGIYDKVVGNFAPKKPAKPSPGR